MMRSHGFCFTVKTLPAAVILPLRATPVVLAAIVKFTVPFPTPRLPEVIVIQLSLVVACHAQRSSANTFKLPVPPLDGKACDEGEMT